MRNTDTVDHKMATWALCLSTAPGGALTTAKKAIKKRR